MFFNQSNNHTKVIKFLLFSSRRSSLLLSQEQQKPSYIYTQKSHYVDVKMKRKKDSFYDSFEIIHKSPELKALISLKNCIANEPNACIPISDVSKRGLEFGLHMKVARFLRLYPSVFEEFTGPNYNLPWFRLTPEAVHLDREERAVYQDRKSDIVDRLKKLILMSKEKKLPLKVIQGMQWYLGFPDDFIQNPEVNLDSCFKFIEMEDGLRGMCVENDNEGETMLSLIQKNAMKKSGGTGVCLSMSSVSFPLFPSKGLRLKRKISTWLDEFQELPYVSPYEDSSDLNPNSDIAEKRLVGVLHELLGLFVDHSAERKKILCLRTYLRLPQKFYKAFDRHPHIFYLSLRNKTCTAILKEAYNDDSTMATHPILEVRKKYVSLMKESELILKRRRQKKQCLELANVGSDVDMDSNHRDSSKVMEYAS